MKYVLDSSVAVKWLIAEADTDKALLFRDDFCNGIHELLAPDVFTVEVAHSLTRAERQGRIAVSEAGKLLVDLLYTLPDIHPHLPLLIRATEISSRMRVGVYDFLYVALAEREKCDFVIADEKLVGNVQPYFPFVLALSSMP